MHEDAREEAQMRKNEYIRTADFESQMRALKTGVKALKMEDEQKVLWMISKVEDTLIKFGDPQEIEVYDFLRVEKR